MLTTLRLLLGKRRPHDLHALYISRENMLHLHKALLAWLITETPPALWEIGCLHQDVVSPLAAHIGPCTHQSVAATIDCPNGAYWRPSYLAQTPVEAHGLATPTRQHSGNRSSQEHVTPLTHGPSPAPPHDPPLTTRAVRTRPTSCGKIAAKPGDHSRAHILCYEEIKGRNAMASNREKTRAHGNRIRKQSTLVEYCPTLIPNSLPVRPPAAPRTLLLPNNMHNMGWKEEPTIIIRPDS